MKKVILIVVGLLVVAAILFITLRKKPNETITTPAVDSSQVYKEKADSAHKVYLDADSVYRSAISDSERAAYREQLIRKIAAGQRDSVREVEDRTRSVKNGLRLPR